MPVNTVKIDRTTAWGNPFKIGSTMKHPVTGRRVKVGTSETSVALYTQWLKTGQGAAVLASARKELHGRNLACWCAPGTPCHGDVLLTLVNAAGARSTSRAGKEPR